MARVELHFDTGEAFGDGKVFVDGEEISMIRYINLFASYDSPTRLIISRYHGNNGQIIPVTDETGEKHALEETFDVFDMLRAKDNKAE